MAITEKDIQIISGKFYDRLYKALRENVSSGPEAIYPHQLSGLAIELSEIVKKTVE